MAADIEKNYLIRDTDVLALLTTCYFHCRHQRFVFYLRKTAFLLISDGGFDLQLAVLYLQSHRNIISLKTTRHFFNQAVQNCQTQIAPSLVRSYCVILYKFKRTREFFRVFRMLKDTEQVSKLKKAVISSKHCPTIRQFFAKPPQHSFVDIIVANKRAARGNLFKRSDTPPQDS